MFFCLMSIVFVGQVADVMLKSLGCCLKSDVSNLSFCDLVLFCSCEDLACFSDLCRVTIFAVKLGHSVIVLLFVF